VKIVLNGESRDVTSNITVQLLLAEFELGTERIAVERNGTIIKKSDYASTILEDSDTLEVVRFVGGG
jgi:thiamine biosynthesis protein ThiS